MIKDFISHKDFLNLLGSFWKDVFQQQDLLVGLTKGQALYAQQMDVNVDELRNMTGVRTTPIHHREVWNKLRMVRDVKTGSFLPLRYNVPGAIYGAAGDPPIYDRIFKYGDSTDFLELPIQNSSPVDVTFLTDGIENPTLILVRGIDFDVQNGMIVFHETIWNGEVMKTLLRNDLAAETTYVDLWGYNCLYDREYLARQWGYLINLVDVHTPEFAQAFWLVWKSRYYGMSQYTLADLLSIYLKCPVCSEEGETVERVVFFHDRWHVFTDYAAYTLDECDEPAVAEQQVLSKYTPIGKRLRLDLPEPVSYMHQNGRTVTYAPAADLGSADTSYQYLVFQADDTPATIRKTSTLDVTPAYITIDGPYGVITVSATNLYRITGRRFTIALSGAVIPGPSTQRVNLQVFNGSGEPLFSEPKTYVSDAIAGRITSVETEDELLRVWPDALVHKVDVVRRIALIGAYRDQELEAIRNTLEGLPLVRNQAVGVVAFTTLQTTDTLGDFSTNPLTAEHLSNFDAVVYDTLDATQSTYYGGVPADAPNILNLDETQASIAALNAQIDSLKNEILALDQGMRAAVSNATESADQDSLLYQLCATRGVPRYDSTSGDSFYAYGLFGALTADDVRKSEVRNVNPPRYRVPKSATYATGSFPGKYVDKANVPIRTEPITAYVGAVDMVVDLDPTKTYILDVRGVQ